MSKRIFFLLGALLPVLALAQTPPPAAPVAPAAPLTPKEEAIQSFSVKNPDEGSVFFSERQAVQEAAESGQPLKPEDMVSVYPRVKNSEDSATSMLKHFFTDMFASVKLKSLKGEKTTEHLTVLPEEFSVDKRHELDTTYTVRNNTGKMMRFDYTTSQRVDVVTQDASGKVIDKWSDDHAFEPQEGIVILNPHERLEYQQVVPTRDMKAGQSYTIQADMSGYPEYTSTKEVKPTP